MTNCIIIEDEPQAVVVLESILKKHFPSINILATFDKISTSANYLKKNKIDFIFLDVQLNGELGIDIANYLTKEEFNFEIIFTTAYSGFALEAFAMSAIDYVLKPIKEERLIEAINRVLKRKTTELEQLKVLQEVATSNVIDKIVLSMTEKKIVLKTDEIIFLKADNVYTEFMILQKTRHVVSKPLKEYEILLSQANYYKPHRSFIINTKYIKSYDKGSSEIEMISGDKISLARDKKKEFEALLNF